MKRSRIPVFGLALLISACGGGAVPDAPVDLRAPEIISFTADPTTVAAGGTSRLTWEVRGTIELLEVASEALYSPIDVTERDAYMARPTVTTTYVLRARNPAGSDQRELIVEVDGGGQ
jgi:hypothetical protein